MKQENFDHIVIAAVTLIKRGLEFTRSGALNKALDFFEERESISNSDWIDCFSRITILTNIEEEARQ